MVKIVKNNNLIKKKIIGIALLVISSFYLLSLFSPERLNTPLLSVAIHLNKLIGLGKYFILIFIVAEGIHLLSGFNIPNLYNRMFGITSLLLVLLSFIHLRLIFLENAYLLAVQGVGGGLYGYHTAIYLNDYFGLSGSYLFLIALGLVSLLFITDLSFLYIVTSGFNKIKIVLTILINFISNKISKSESRRKIDLKKSVKIYSSQSTESEIPNRRAEPIFKRNALAKEKKKELSSVQEIIKFPQENNKGEKISEPSYYAPPLNLLNEVKKEYKDRDIERVKENIILLQNTLDNFNIQGKVIGATKGPTVTRYEIQPAPGVKVSRITNLSNDIALAFASPSVRIEAPIPGKNAIGIEVPNREKNVVLLREIIESKEYKNNTFILPIVLGKDIGGNNIIADLVDLPHLLIAGSTGSGKSVCLNTIILSLIYRFGPDAVKFLMIDPKRVELNIYNGIPHLITPIVTNTKKVDKVFNWALYEMERRFKIFAEIGVRNLQGYHDYIKSIKSEENNLPYIVFIIDELADLMLSAPGKVEDSLCRLAQMTRATGIHLLLRHRDLL